ncbi:MAG: glycosyltransferase family 39 protein [Anaerolineae bacterium]|nr:glycosyltransferase family 39 protein [Thermoflexales bacterium]MDW8406365.1 glycosyltransferase family 39 protein [Anaerolineae bacterium]
MGTAYSRHPPFWLSRWRDWLPLLLVVLAGAALRLVDIGDLPPGLYRDEGFYGLDALNVLRGRLALYFTANNGREGMFMYLLSASIAVLGRTPEALRIVSALTGVVTLIAIYAAGRALFSHRTGVLAAAILSVTFWHLAISRVAFRAILLPFWLCVAAALFAAWLRSGASRHGLAVCAGAAFGLTFYTYTSGQLIALLFIGFVGLAALVPALKVALPASRRAWLAFFAGAVVTLLPLLIWLARHPDVYFTRAGQVSVLSSQINQGDLLGALLGNILKTVGMIAWQGDRIWRHNLSLRPVYPDWPAAAFLVGLVICVWRALRGVRAAQGLAHGMSPASAWEAAASVWVLLWLVIFLMPTVLAEDAPHFLRAIGALPAVCILAASGLETTLRWLSRRGLLNLYPARLQRLISPPAVLASLALILSGLQAAGDYFGVYVRHPMTAYWLEDSNVQLGRAVNASVERYGAGQVWLDARLATNNPTLLFLSPAVEAGLIKIVTSDLPPDAPRNRPIVLLVDPNHDWSMLRQALPPNSELSIQIGPFAQGDLDSTPRRAFIAVHAAPRSGGEEPPLAQFEQGIVLQDAHVAPPANGAATYTITLRWRAMQPVPEDLAVFVHWLRDGQLIAQHDSSPAEGYLPLPVWRSGDVIVDPHPVTVPGGRQAGDVLRVGMYRRTDGRRLQVQSASSPAAAPAEWVDLTDRLPPSTP